MTASQGLWADMGRDKANAVLASATALGIVPVTEEFEVAGRDAQKVRDRMTRGLEMQKQLQRQQGLGLGNVWDRFELTFREAHDEFKLLEITQTYPRVSTAGVPQAFISRDPVKASQGAWAIYGVAGEKPGVGRFGFSSMDELPQVIRASPGAAGRTFGYSSMPPAEGVWTRVRHGKRSMYAMTRFPLVPPNVMDEVMRIKEILGGQWRGSHSEYRLDLVWIPRWELRRKMPRVVISRDPALILNFRKRDFLIGVWGGDQDALSEWLISEFGAAPDGPGTVAAPEGGWTP